MTTVHVKCAFICWAVLSDSDSIYAILFNRDINSFESQHSIPIFYNNYFYYSPPFLEATDIRGYQHKQTNKQHTTHSMCKDMLAHAATCIGFE